MTTRRRVNPVLIGVFVLGAVALGTGVAVIWGAGWLFRQTTTFVAYFGGSVNGLNLGAPVKFRGAQVGSVVQIRSRLAQAATTRPEDFRMPVWFEIDLHELTELGGRPIAMDRAQVDELVAHGLRAQLQLESIVTGVLYVGLDFFPGSPAVMIHADRPDIFEIPAVPTALERASEVLAKLMAQIEKSDIDGAVRSIMVAADGVNELARSPDLVRAITAARAALESARRLVDAAEPRVDPLLRSVEATAASARDSLRRLDAALADVQTMLDTEGPLSVELGRTLVEVGAAARSIGDLASYLERNPDALLVGRAAR